MIINIRSLSPREMKSGLFKYTQVIKYDDEIQSDSKFEELFEVEKWCEKYIVKINKISHNPEKKEFTVDYRLKELPNQHFGYIKISDAKKKILNDQLEAKMKNILESIPVDVSIKPLPKNKTVMELNRNKKKGSIKDKLSSWVNGK